MIRPNRVLCLPAAFLLPCLAPLAIVLLLKFSVFTTVDAIWPLWSDSVELTATTAALQVGLILPADKLREDPFHCVA